MIYAYAKGTYIRDARAYKVPRVHSRGRERERTLTSALRPVHKPEKYDVVRRSHSLFADFPPRRVVVVVVVSIDRAVKKLKLPRARIMSIRCVARWRSCAGSLEGWSVFLRRREVCFCEEVVFTRRAYVYETEASFQFRDFLRVAGVCCNLNL